MTIHKKTLSREERLAQRRKDHDKAAKQGTKRLGSLSGRK